MVTPSKGTDDFEEGPDAVSSSLPLFGLLAQAAVTPRKNVDDDDDNSVDSLDPAAPQITDLSPMSVVQSPRAIPSNMSNPSFSLTQIKNLQTPDTLNPKLITELILQDQNLVSLLGLELERFPNLTLANFSFNQLSTLDDLFCPPSLQILDVSHNRLTNVDALSEKIQPTNNISVLRINGNQITSLKQLESMVNLKELWCGKNAIQFPDLLFLGGMRELEHVVLKPNFCCSTEGYEKIVLSFLQNLKTFDGRPVGEDELSLANLWAGKDGHGVIVKMKFDLLQADKKQVAIDNVAVADGANKTTTEERKTMRDLVVVKQQQKRKQNKAVVQNVQPVQNIQPTATVSVSLRENVQNNRTKNNPPPPRLTAPPLNEDRLAGMR